MVLKFQLLKVRSHQMNECRIIKRDDVFLLSFHYYFLNDRTVLLSLVFGYRFILLNDLVELQVQAKNLGNGVETAEDQLIEMPMRQQ